MGVLQSGKSVDTDLMQIAVKRNKSYKIYLFSHKKYNSDLEISIYTEIN